MSTPLSAELVDFTESGVSILVASCREGGLPACVRGVGAAVARGRKQVTVYVTDEVSGELLEGLQPGRPIAVTLCRPIDHRTIQLKGPVLEVRPSGDGDRLVQERYLAGFVEQLYCVGLPRAITQRLRIFPSTAVVFEVDELFDQTPGPGAGQVLTGPAHG